MFKHLKILFSIFVIVAAGIFVGTTWYKNGFGIGEHKSQVEDIPIHNTIYMLDEGNIIEQRFVSEEKFLCGVNLLLVNVSEESQGQIKVELRDMWGDVIAERTRDLSTISSGVYEYVQFNEVVNIEGNEDLTLCIYSQNADVIPGVVGVEEEEDTVENVYCWYNYELTEKGLIIGYVYGREEYIGYKYQTGTKQASIMATILALVVSGILIYSINKMTLVQVAKPFRNLRNWYQTAMILMFFFAFFSSAVINKTISGTKIPVFVYFFLAAALIFAASMGLLFIRRPKGKYRAPRNVNVSKRKYIDRGEMVVVIAAILCRLPMFTHMQRWDGAIYYAAIMRACSNFDFTVQSVWNGFRLAGHYTLGYAFFMAIGEFLMPGQVTGVLFITLIMTVAALVCIYRLLRYFWCRMPEIHAAAVTVIVSVVPIFWGLFTNINIDYFLLIFFVYLVYAEYKGWNIMRFFWLMAVMLTKETGMVIIAGYSVAYVFKLWKQTPGRSVRDKLFQVLHDSFVKSILLCFIIFCVYVVKQGSLFDWMGFKSNNIFALPESVVQAAQGKNAFLYMIPSIGHKIVQICTFNFTWIPVTVIIVCMCRRLFVRGNDKKISKSLITTVGALIVFLLFSIFSTFWIPSVLGRYIIFSTVLLWILAFILLYETFPLCLESGKTYCAVGAITLLLLIQNFYYIDPVSNLLFDSLDSGRGKILSAEVNYSNYGDTFVNNYRYRYIDQIIDKMLADAEYHPGMQIIIPYERDYVYVTDNGAYSINWNTKKRKRTMLSAGENPYVAPMQQILLEQIMNNDGGGLAEEAIVYFVPYIEFDEEGCIEKLRNYYQVGERREISNWGGSIVYYALKRK